MTCPPIQAAIDFLFCAPQGECFIIWIHRERNDFGFIFLNRHLKPMTNTVIFRERHWNFKSLSLLCIKVQGLPVLACLPFYKKGHSKNYTVSKQKRGVRGTRVRLWRHCCGPLLAEVRQEFQQKITKCPPSK